MTLESLSRKPIGVLQKRSFTIDNEHEEFYFLVKCKDDKYFISFSEDVEGCINYSQIVSKENMVKLFNDKDYSDSEAFDLYMTIPQLSFWITDD